MTLPVHPLECGQMTCDAGVMMQGASGEFRMPVLTFLVEHPDGLVLFDTGLHPDLAHSTERMHGLESMFTATLEPHQTVGPRLLAAGFDPAAVAIIVSSHLHFDHCGGHGEVPNGRLVVQAEEWRSAHDGDLIALGAYDPADFELGHDVQLLDGEHDLFGDGRIRLVPTPGHTAGHQSMVIDGTTILVGDACYCRQALDEDALPPIAHDPAAQQAGFAWLRAQESAGATLVFSHPRL